MQFKHELIDTINLNLTQKDATNDNCNNKQIEFGILYDMPNKIPRSSIVFDKTNVDNPLRQGMLLFEKYVKAGDAPLEINIAWKNRNAISRYFKKAPKEINDNFNMIELLCIFDDAIREISETLDACFVRYNHHIVT